jgi:hypothetical protein
VKIPLGFRYGSPAELFRDLLTAQEKDGTSHQSDKRHPAVRIALQILSLDPDDPEIKVRVPRAGDGRFLVINGTMVDFGKVIEKSMLKPFNGAHDSRQWIINERTTTLEKIAQLEDEGLLTEDDYTFLSRIDVHIGWSTMDPWFPSKMLHEAYHLGQMNEFLRQVRERANGTTPKVEEAGRAAHT